MKNGTRFILTIITALMLNIIWEFFHYSLYIDLSGIPEHIHLLSASLTDMFIILGIFLLISAKNKNLNWIKKPDKIDYLLIISLGLVISTLIEIWALSIERWKYTELMPTIFGVGLSPLIQLFITAIISLMIIKSID